MYSTSWPGLRSLCLLTASTSAPAEPEPSPCVTKRMFWSMADLSAVSDSAGLTLLSNGTISNFTPAGLFLLNRSARYWKVLSWFWPMGAIRPDSGSIQPILTVSPFCAKATPGCSARPASARMEANARGLLRKVMAVSPWSPRGSRSWLTLAQRRAGALRDYPEGACRARDKPLAPRSADAGQHVVAELLAPAELPQL